MGRRISGIQAELAGGTDLIGCGLFVRLVKSAHKVAARGAVQDLAGVGGARHERVV